MKPACSFWPAIGRTVDPRSDAELRAHLASCAECWAALDQLKRAAAALRSVPHPVPDPDAREQARTRLVAAIGGLPPARPVVRRLWLRGGAALAASLCAATVVAAVGTQVWQSEPPAVEPPPPPARERPSRPRRASAAATPLPAPEIQGPPAPPVAAPPRRIRLEPAPLPVEEPPAEVVPVTPPPVPGATPEELAFNQGWEALRVGDHRRAAAQMERALALGPGSALAEDARYWRAVALGRAGDNAGARAAMEQLLRRHPGSPRAGEISAMLGWLLFDAGDRAGAEALFRAAERDGKASVRQSARAGLQAIAAPPP